MKYVDFLIVGAGFAGSVIAERLNSIGKKVLVIEKRNHVGGNCYDFYNKEGVLVHKYGPHLFHTNYKEVFDYLSKFTKWVPYEHRVKAKIGNTFYTIPINMDTINKFFNLNLKNEKEVKEFLDSKREKIMNPKNAEEQVLSTLGKELYETFFKNYTIKQWKTDPKYLDASITARIPVRTDNDDRYFTDKFQFMPAKGYSDLFENLLKGISVLLNTDFKDIQRKVAYKHLIFTGPIDDFFNFKFGKLGYRSCEFKFENFNREFFQDWCVINYPNEEKFTRIIEIKHATKQKIPVTSIAKEYPSSFGEPLYPILNEENQELYEKYKEEVSKLKNVFFLGRLGQYKYLNMDQVVKEALALFERIK